MEAHTHILYVDDSKFDRQLVRHVLEKEHGGFQITEAATEQEFNARLAEHHYDLVLTDFNILGFEGFKVYEAVRQRHNDVPVVIVTGTGSEEVAVEAMKRGVSDYVVKSAAHIQQLPQILLSAIEKHRLTQERHRTHTERRARTQQQAVVAALGQRALAGLDLEDLVEEAVRGLVDTLGLTYCDFFEYLPHDETLLFRTGEGWYASSAAQVLLDVEEGTQAHFTLNAGGPVVSRDLMREHRFLPAPLYISHGIVSSITVRVQAKGQAFGILGAHATERHAFTSDDVHFLQAIANVLSAAIERKLFEHDLIVAKEEAEEMSRLKSAFLTNMSHEIRTPLTSIIGFSSIMASEAPPEHRELIQLIERSGHRLLHTLNAVLDLSMLEAGTLTLNPEPLNIVDEVESKVQYLQPQAEQKGLTLEARHEVAEVWANVDRACLDRTMHNLISNALKFTEEGEVYTEVGIKDDRVEIRVTDTGIGISDTFMPQLFDAFKQESMGISRSYEGSGLGLTVTKQFVTLMRGELSVESCKGEGSVFILSFPRLMQEVEQALHEKAIAPTPEPKQYDRTPRILAVEDNPEAILVMKRFLRESYEVDVAHDEAQAMAFLRENTYDLLLMDINLGTNMDGIDVMRKVRQQPGYAHIPIIAATAYAMPGDREHFLKQGFDAYVSKPFTKQTLREAIEAVLPETL